MKLQYDVFMRTTCDLNDALMTRVQQLAVVERISLKEVLNKVILAGLERPNPPAAERWVCPVHDLGTARVDYGKAWALIDQLEADAVAEKMSLRK